MDHSAESWERESLASSTRMDQEMTRQQTFKRRVRGRMAKTGESYTTARRQLLARAGDLFAETSAERPSAADAARRRLLERRRRWVEEASGRAMEEWIALHDGTGRGS